MAFDRSTKDDLLEVWRRIFPSGYTVPIEDENNGQGLDIYVQQAAQLARASAAVNTGFQSLFLKPHSEQTAPPASGEARSSGTVAISRLAPASGAVTLIQGTQLRTEIVNTVGLDVDGPVFEFTADATIAVGSLGPVTGSVQAIRPGPQSDQPAGRIVGFVARGRSEVTGATVAVVGTENQITDSGTPDRFTPAMVGQYVRFSIGLNIAVVPRRILSVTVGPTTSVAVVDGAALTAESGATVLVLEFEDIALSVVQAAATTGGLHGELDAIGRNRRTGRAPAEGDTEYRSRICTLDDTISPAAILRICHRILDPLGIGFRLKETRDIASLPGFILDRDAFDFGDITDGIVLLSATCGQVRFFIICVGLSNAGEFGAPYDTPFDDNAYDFMFYDGFAVGWASALIALFDAVDRARAAGVCFDLVLDTSL